MLLLRRPPCLRSCDWLLNMDGLLMWTALRSIKANVSERSPTVRVISTVRGERLQPIANAF